MRFCIWAIFYLPKYLYEFLEIIFIYLELLKYQRLQLSHRLRLPKMILNLLLINAHNVAAAPVSAETISSLCSAGAGTTL